jgi:imidazolonepropionase-like amidohydrolase
MDEPTARLIAEKGIWLSTQAFPDEMADAFPAGSQERSKALEVFAGTDRTVELAKKYKIKTAFGTDILFSAGLAKRQGELLAKFARWYTPAETLAMATGTPSCLRCRASAIPIQASSAWSSKARSLICCSSTAIRS